MALYNATDGPNWANNTNWLSDRSLGEWHGVTTDPNGRVAGLNLNENRLIGTIPPELGDLANLQWLYLGGNQLTGQIPFSLGGLANLRELSLWENQLTGQIPSFLGNLANLQGLYLDGNQLSGQIPSSLGNLANLQGLYLGGNQLTGQIPPSMGSLANLQSLDLGGNQLSGGIPSSLGNLANLQGLYLGGNQLSGEIPFSLGNLANLQGLYLGGNQLSGEIPSSLGGLANLQELDLGGNQLTGQIPFSLGGLANLQELDLWGNQLTGQIPFSLGNLANLQELYLWDNQLSGQIPSSLGSLASLQGLYLGGNQLTGQIPSSLGSLANLQELDLSYNQLSGMIPAELGNLADLEALFLSGNQLTGCIPVGIADVANNDFSELGLPFCGGAPGAPTISTVTPGVGFLTVTWSAPGGPAGPAVSAYDLRHIESAAGDKSDANWTVVDDAWTAGSGALSYQISGLTNGTQYDVQVRAVTADGDGPWSVSAIGTPATWRAIRSFSPPSVGPDGVVVVTITTDGLGGFGQVVETLPPGFSYVSSSLSDGAVTVGGQDLSFILLGETEFTYTVIAPGAAGHYSFSGVLTNSAGEEVPVGGALTITVGALPSVIVSRAAGSEDTLVRPGSPVSLTATFSGPVSGVAIDDINVGNGTASNFAGTGAVYTFDVTPSAIGEVTVDIAASVAQDADGNGNVAAPQFSLGIPYDDDGSGQIDLSEVYNAIDDYFSYRIDLVHVWAAVDNYFSG